MMHSKWGDAAAQAVAFDQVMSDATNLAHEPFCRHLMHLFSQLSAMATLTLHVNKAGLGEANGVHLEWLREPGAPAAAEPPSVSREPSRRSSRSPATAAAAARLKSAVSTKPARRARAAALNDSFSEPELDFYDKNRGCAVHTTCNRILRSLTTRHHHGGLRAPPPIVSRIYQELSNGLLAYNQAVKMKEVPVPFMYVQFNSLLLFFFSLLTPFSVGAFTSSYSSDWPSILLSGWLSAFVVGSFNAMWLVANELEDPFGIEPNDISMMAFHHEFCALLKGLLDCPWMEADNWTVKEGPNRRATQPSPATQPNLATQPSPTTQPSPAAKAPSAAADGRPPAVRVGEVSVTVVKPGGQEGGGVQEGGGGGDQEGSLSEKSQWDKVRAQVGSFKDVRKAGDAPASAKDIALAQFTNRAKHHQLMSRLQLGGFLGPMHALFQRRPTEQEVYDKKMKEGMFVIPG